LTSGEERQSNRAAILIKAAKASEEQRSFDEPELLEAYLFLRTLQAATADPDGALEPATGHTGYLTRSIGSHSIFVPFNLAYMSPSHADLRATLAIGDAIRVCSDGAFCLSGSTTFAGRLGMGGDLDFCEYRFDNDDELRQGVCNLLDAEAAPLVWIKLANGTLNRPWPDVAALMTPPLERIKLDFVSNSALGVLPTTSLVLATQDGEDVAAGLSYAYQEAVILGPKPVRLLVRPDRIGAYIVFLKRHIRELLDGRDKHAGAGAPIKALKRCLSLLLMVEWPDEVDRLVQKLNDGVLKDVALDARQDELERMAAGLPETPTWLSTEVEALRTRPSSAPDTRSRALKIAADIAEALYERIEILFAEAA
jgi:hypothetical protein